LSFQGLWQVQRIRQFAKFKGVGTEAVWITDSASINFGQTVRLGQFEAATEAVLYEFDPDFRRKERKRRIVEDATFGGSLRRLRIQKGLKRSDFTSLSSKEVARIERGEVGTPRDETLNILSEHLGVPAEDIDTY